ncbi:MAG: ABC transporter ATP-binding protein/permease [Spirochaetaceae bacterium]|jgi:ATP-binding cassette subfamily B protein|nr:ABC transporter ATP-binding protein/permease [Spirochaetaceae bacterium]
MYKLLQLDKDGRKMFNGAVIACVLTNLTLFLSFMAAMQFISVLLGPLAGGGALDVKRLWLFFACALAAAGVYYAAFRGEYQKTYTAAYNESEKMRVELAERIRKLPLSFFNNKDLTELTTNMMADCASIEHAISHVAPQLVAYSIASVLICGMLAFYDWRMAAALFAALPLSVAVILLSKRIQRKYSERLVAVKLEAAERAQEYLEGIKVIKAFGLSGEKFTALESALGRLKKESFKFELIAGALITSSSVFLQAGTGLVIFAGVTLLSGGEIDPLKFFFFTLISATIYSPLLVILTLLPEFFYMLVSTRRMRELRNEPVMTGSEDITLRDYNIELKNVSFAYRGGGENDVVKNVSLSIPQNGVCAFVGPSGSGKTTLSHLIARFWDVRDGDILVDGESIRGMDPEALMRFMSFVFQDVILFNDTVMNNIRIGKQGAADEEVYRAARMARCDEFIRAMPSGYETVIGENGSTLSGGERQRLSIARALLKNAPIVLLDEATASLDPENETEVQAALSELVKGRAVIVIAHRLRTVLGAGKIAVMENGRLVEEGSGSELLAKNGLFARLYRIQRENIGWSV